MKCFCPFRQQSSTHLPTHWALTEHRREHDAGRRGSGSALRYRWRTIKIAQPYASRPSSPVVLRLCKNTSARSLYNLLADGLVYVAGRVEMAYIIVRRLGG